MIWQLIISFLTAMGIVLLLWLFFGALVLPMKPAAWLWQAQGDAQTLQKQYEAYVWLRESGLGPARLILWDAGLDQEALRLARWWAYSDGRILFAEGSARLNELAYKAQERAHGADDLAGDSGRSGLSK